MVIGVISDTHGNLRLMHRTVEEMVRDFGVELLFHAGDNFEDAVTLANSGYLVYMVPGLQCAEYHDGRIPNAIVEIIDGVSIAMTHAEGNLRAREMAAAVVITGHTHVARIEQLGRSIYLNPGHVKSALDRGQKASFGIIRTGEFEVQFAIHELSGETRHTLTMPRSKLA